MGSGHPVLAQSYKGPVEKQVDVMEIIARADALIASSVGVPPLTDGQNALVKEVQLGKSKNIPADTLTSLPSHVLDLILAIEQDRLIKASKNR